MFNSSSVIAGLDLGTSKICAVIGDVGAAGALNIIGIGQAKSRGVRKGEIIDAAVTAEDIRNAVVEAETMADAEIRSVFLGVTGAHVRGFNNHGYHPVVSHDREISEEDGQDVIKNAKAINLSAENNVIHVIRQHFLVDGQDGIINPVGMFGARVEAQVHVVHGNFNRLQNPIRAVRSLQLEVECIVFAGLASSLALLTSQQKELGALVIDLGSGTTEYVVYAHGVIKHTGVLAVGGDHVTNDLAYGLRIPMARAEQLKIDHGTALPEPAAKGQTIPVSGDLGLPEKSVNLEHLHRIMHLRLEEIFRLIACEVESAGLLDYLRCGVILCGGGARIPGVQALAAQVFSLPATLGKTNSISGLKSALDQPEFATAIGLAKFGSFEHRKKAEQHRPFAHGLRSRLGQFFRRA